MSRRDVGAAASQPASALAQISHRGNVCANRAVSDPGSLPAVMNDLEICRVELELLNKGSGQKDEDGSVGGRSLTAFCSSLKYIYFHLLVLRSS